jgi:hypothetical protein
MADTKKEIKGGRPAKFQEPSRPITVTLPERVLGSLAKVDADRARAIVKATEALMQKDKKPVELVEVAQGLAVIVVDRNQYLHRIPWLRLVEIAPARFLLCIPPGTPVDSLEIAIMDLLESCPEEDKEDRRSLSQLLEVVRNQRLKQSIFKTEILLVRLGIGAAVLSLGLL